MFTPLGVLANIANHALTILASPAQEPLNAATALGRPRHYDIQGHRGGRGIAVENTLASTAWGLIEGVSTIEVDNGITKDGVVVVWHDTSITPEKCVDTAPAFPGDPDFPYVGKFIANLTLAQIKTVDCGSKRQEAFPLQLTYPGIRISTLQELFDFVGCADPAHHIQWNIESKIDARHPNRTMDVDTFVSKQSAVFSASPYFSSITYESFDWRTLIAMKAYNPSMRLSALIDDDYGYMPDNSTSPWLAGLRLDSFPGPTQGQQVAQAAHAIGANILSPSAKSDFSPGEDPLMPDYMAFTTGDMVDEAHKFGMEVKVWTVNHFNLVEHVLALNVDGIITDYPDALRRLLKYNNIPAAPKYPKQRVLACLNEHLARQSVTLN
ncbi:uncharacterized protein FIBRA_02376 [Fibroporia radiculosa]|uniref:GP-PDE domain-containing protein n=1 Tax=Fibroporia radiculosa TaxID=599839 RepID=J4I910_9APHY|nr:uncharacterized protein FIBRA_02376 [Fibroporia radiculosa]CCM00346.1 predicted protein [Fibroporia radiculosa]